MRIITDRRVINAVAKEYKLSFCPKYKYYDGDGYTNTNGERLPHEFICNGRVYILKYYDGCFNPFLTLIN